MGSNLRAILFRYNAYSFLENVDLAEALEIIVEIVEQHYEERLFLNYSIGSLFREEQISYVDYRKKLGLDNSNKTVDIEKKRADSEKLIAKIKKSKMKVGE